MKTYMPTSLPTLYEALNAMTPESKVIGGGTDLVMHLNARRVQPDALLYVGGLEEMRKIEHQGENLYIGAAVTMNEMVGSELLQGKFRSIIDAAGDVGSEQIRNSGTIGGNIANASPAGDLIPIMFMLNAVLVIATPEGEMREVAIRDFIVGPGRTTLEFNEVLVGIKLPVPQSETYKSRFVKLGSRKKVTISRICVSMALDIKDEVIQSASVYVGSISIVPVHLEEAENIMVGKTITEDLSKEVAKILSNKIMEVTPEKFDRDYKVWAAKGVIADVLNCF